VDELKNRLQGRGTESEESLNARVNKAAYELSFKHSFNHIIVNNDLRHACKEAEAIVSAFIH
jgi:guanylate kinase